MEDYVTVNQAPREEFKADPLYKHTVFSGVFDGHGGSQAAKYASENMWDEIQNQDNFWLQDEANIKESLEKAYDVINKKMETARSEYTVSK